MVSEVLGHYVHVVDHAGVDLHLVAAASHLSSRMHFDILNTASQLDLAAGLMYPERQVYRLVLLLLVARRQTNYFAAHKHS